MSANSQRKNQQVNTEDVAVVRNLIPQPEKSRSFRVGVERGYEKAKRLDQMSAEMKHPLRSSIVRGRPYWMHKRDINEYIRGYAVGFDRFVAGQWPNGMEKDGSDG